MLRLILSLLLLLITATTVQAEESCLDCHKEKDPVTLADGTEKVIYTDENILAASPHADVKCGDCHRGAARESDEPSPLDIDIGKPTHPAKLGDVSCAACHRDQKFEHHKSAHGAAERRNDPVAPTCKSCHGAHDVNRASDPASLSHRVNAPRLCGGCHKPHGKVRAGKPLTDKQAADNIPMRIHGPALFERGLLAAATCTDCHSAHMPLSAAESASSVSPKNIRETCEKCHTKAVTAHKDFLDISKWKSGALPACGACHPPHTAPMTIPTEIDKKNDSCLICHNPTGVARLKEKGAQAPLIDPDVYKTSVHAAAPCVGCHPAIDKSHTRPDVDAPVATCDRCHDAFGKAWKGGAHAAAQAKGVANAPGCPDCHGTHGILHNEEPAAKTFRTNIPKLCADCHGPHAKDNVGGDPKQTYIDYAASEHGHAVMAQGSMVAAVCVDCHDSHGILPKDDPASRVYRTNITATCGQCHRRSYLDYTEGAHNIAQEQEGKRRPACDDCHAPHKMIGVDKPDFVDAVTEQCAACHEKLSTTYGETMHGKAHLLGYDKVATCDDCHGAHTILPATDPRSTIHPDNILATCKKCHPKAPEGFVGYITHADYTDPESDPQLHYVYLFMTSLLFGVFSFFGLHTALWIPRSMVTVIQYGFPKPKGSGRYIRRFDMASRLTHLMVVISFLLLAATGLSLKFAADPWAISLATVFGGVPGAGLVHRIAAVVTFGYFFFHLGKLAGRKKEKGESWRRFLTGPDSLLFNAHDIRDLFATLKWFLWLGPRPQYGRWTYWEKFDYFAVFWGVPVIGLSGLVLWFAEEATRFLPGWSINVAMIIHSDEALLAIGFIFLIHFFHTHLRPDAFPMDVSIFTGVTPEERYRHERSIEMKRMHEEGRLDKALQPAPSPTVRLLAYVVGGLFLGTGVVLMLLILWSLFVA